ncbi:MAG: hypothetical protein V4502_09940 [Pseudomonadota bacterium]
MTIRTSRALLAATAMLALGACQQTQTTNNTTEVEANTTEVTTNNTEVVSNNAEADTNAAAPSEDPTASAESAAPASIARNASIVTADSSGAMTTAREGSNGWTCMADNPVTPGPDPMCMDANAAKWTDAWIHHKPPPTGTVGMIYMLEGGTDASNSDPYATKPTAQNDWVKTGPHVMIVGSKEILAGHPSAAKPDTSAPYVMWAGTPYAHLMVPVAR